MNDDLMSQLPEPYRGAWNVLRESMDLEILLKSTLYNAMQIVSANWGMLVLELDTSVSRVPYIIRVLPDVKPRPGEQSDISRLVFSLACKVMRQTSGEVIPDLSKFSPSEKQAILTEYFPKQMFGSLDELPYAEETVSLLIVPVFIGQPESGVIVLGRPADTEFFKAESLADAELFVASISRYLHASLSLSELVRKNTELIHLMAFEIKVPLVSMRGFTEMLLDTKRTGELTETQKRLLEIIHQSAERINKLLNNFTDLAKLEANWVRFEDAEFDMQEVVLKQLESFEPKFKDKKQKVTLSLGNKILIHGDRIKIDHVVETIIKNAYSYSPEGGAIKISLDVQEGYARFLVSDEGIGLTDDEKSRLFQKFYRSERARVVPGIGLELYVAKEFIEKMGGQVGAEGSPDQGSTFWFTLPIAKE